MFKVKQLVWVTGCVSVLGGCALYPSSSKQALNMKPVMEIRHNADNNPKTMYSLGRYHQGKVNYTEAIAAYEKALAADPAHVEAHNGLGVSYSLQGRHELALQHLRKAIELSPMSAHLHNNLGYVHMVLGQESEAAAAFEQALRLNPENRHARKNLVTVYERVGLHDKAAMLALAGPSPDAPVAVPATPSAARSANEITATVEKQIMERDADKRLVQVTPNVFEFKINEAASMMAALTGKTRDKASTPQDTANLGRKNVNIEISNGNGVSGMARQVSGFLQQGGFTKARLTNQQPFQQKQTEIHFSSGNDVLASQISRLMPKQALMVENSGLHRNVDVRVLLGKDVASEVAYFNNSRGKIQKIALNTRKETIGKQAKK